jgi:hypothetical protein
VLTGHREQDVLDDRVDVCPPVVEEPVNLGKLGRQVLSHPPELLEEVLVVRSEVDDTESHLDDHSIFMWKAILTFFLDASRLVVAEIRELLIMFQKFKKPESGSTETSTKSTSKSLDDAPKLDLSLIDKSLRDVEKKALAQKKEKARRGRYVSCCGVRTWVVD